MADLYVAMGIMAGLSVAVFFIARRVFRGISRSAGLVALLAAVAAMALYLQHGQDQLRYARWLPVSAVVIYANLTPLIGAVAAGVIWHAVRPATADPASGEHPPRALVRRTVLITALWGVSAFQAWHVAWAKAPPLSDRRGGPVVYQTTQASCSPAAAATLLRTIGIRTTEAEMARLCLTTRQGTRTLGVYRGLLLKAGDAHAIETYTGSPDGLRAFATAPLLLNVGLDPRRTDVDPRYVNDWGWSPGARHTVVLLGFAPNGPALVADPAVGVELWTMDAIRTLWRGEAFKLVPAGR